MAPARMAGPSTITHASLMRALLGSGADPFASYQPPSDVTFSTGKSWYRSNFAYSHRDLARLLADHAGAGGWILEVGSFIGGSGILLAREARKVNAAVVCMDSWLGDVSMWLKRKGITLVTCLR